MATLLVYNLSGSIRLQVLDKDGMYITGYKRGITRALLIVLLVSTMAISLYGCGQTKVYEPIEYSDGADYKTFNYQSGNVQFSVEYPESYRAPNSPAEYLRLALVGNNNIGYTTPFIKQPVSETYIGLIIMVSYYDIDENLPSVGAAVKEVTSVDENGPSLIDFKVLKKSKVLVSGIEGTEVIISFSLHPFFDNNAPVENEIQRQIFISQNNMIWQLWYWADAARADEADIDFDHMVRTFRILD